LHEKVFYIVGMWPTSVFRIRIGKFLVQIFLYPSRIPDLGSNSSTKRGEGKILFVLPLQ
jgi:hypothetical protein